MERVRITELRGNKTFLEEVRWDVTPKVLFNPHPGTGNDKEASKVNVDGYMLYVEVIDTVPVLVIMKNKYSMSKTVAYLDGAPEDLLREAAHCTPEECVAGMYPLTKALEAWLKKELGAS
jgi:hypothetical protein